MTTTRDQLERNLADVRARIEAACAKAGRDPHEVTLVAVTKYAELQWVRELVEMGHTELGESRPQQLVERVEQLPAEIDWHMIGHLQRNKVRRVLPIARLIHSVDSLRLLAAIDRIAGEDDLRPRVLLEVNVSGEEAKHGFAPAEVREQWNTIASYERVEIGGLMAMAPRVDHPADARPYFRRLRELRDELAATPTAATLPELSMGMSGDFDIAIEEGATLVRVGSGLFEGLR